MAGVEAGVSAGQVGDEFSLRLIHQIPAPERRHVLQSEYHGLQGVVNVGIQFTGILLQRGIIFLITLYLKQDYGTILET